RERVLPSASLYRHSSIAYAESIDKLKANFLEANPHCFGAVPRVYEKVHARILENAEKAGGLKKKIFAWALRVGRERLACQEKGVPMPAGLPRKAASAAPPPFS